MSIVEQEALSRAAVLVPGARASLDTPSVVEPVAEPVTPTPAPAARGSRDLWFDTLRAAALVRVVTYHVVGWVWLPAVFPSMGIMFALAGSLMAASLTRAPSGGHWAVIRKRMRRLLPPLWLMAAVLVPVMLRHGWTVTETAGAPLHWDTAWLWLLPLSDPPGSAWAADWVVPLWYLRTYLWFVLLSPVFLWLLRRWPKRVLALPLVTLAALTVGVVEPGGRAGDLLSSLTIFGGCWLLGFLHHDGRLREMSWRVVAPVGIALLAAGLAWAFTHPDPVGSWDLDEIPMAQGLYSFGAVLLLMRARPDFSWLARHRIASGIVAVFNARAVTIYLWNNVAIFLATPLMDSVPFLARLDDGGVPGRIVQYLLSWVCIGGAIVLLGWIEDVAAQRPVRINPWPRRPLADDHALSGRRVRRSSSTSSSSNSFSSSSTPRAASASPSRSA